MSDYNGWTNYATWDTVLWVDNDYDSYKQRVSYNVSDADDCEYFVRNLLDKEILANIEREIGPEYTLDDVNWQEIYEAWSEE